MKKLYCILGFFIFLCTSFSVAAEVIEYQPNLFTDETTIEEDFQNLNMDINDYYQPSYRYGKWYVVAMSEAYADTESFDIQTYFYIYNPSSPKNYEYWYQDNDDVGEEHFNEIDSFKLDYKISGNQKSVISDVLSINYEHHLYKVKGFTYSYTDKAEIEVNKIQNYMTIGPGFISESTFKSTCQHSKINGFSVELYFNSTLIIDEREAADIKVDDDYFESSWKHFWNKGWGRTNELHLIFYNFNFPKNISPNSIEYAKFQYNYVEMKETWAANYDFSVDYSKEILSRETRVREYLPGTQDFIVDGKTTKLEFQTFVLGNRIEKESFGKLEFTDEEKEKFNYDCSVLLDSNIYIDHKAGTVQTLTSSELQNIEFLELWYKKDGVIYKCQVVSNPVEKPDKINPGKKKTWWDKFLEFLVKMFDFIFYDFFHLKFWIPDIAKQIISGIILFVGVFFVIPKLIKWIKKLYRIVFSKRG